MKTEKIQVTSGGKGLQEALDLSAQVASRFELSHREATHIRLLTEEMMGLLRGLTGEVDADFWIEGEDRHIELHLATETLVNTDKREKLLAVSSTGKNAAAKGFMGKVRDIFERALEADGDAPSTVGSYGFFGPVDFGTGDPDMVSMTWSMRSYVADVEAHKDEEAEAWDELEKSIVAKLADDVSVSIKGRQVELVISKWY